MCLCVVWNDRVRPNLSGQGQIRVEAEVNEVRMKENKSPRGENLMALLTRLRITYSKGRLKKYVDIPKVMLAIDGMNDAIIMTYLFFAMIIAN